MEGENEPPNGSKVALGWGRLWAPSGMGVKV